MSFSFRRFYIDDTHCGMKVGTDGVLLGAWADASHARRILDLGSGSGLIALMLAQRYPGAQVVGVEIDPEAARDARANVAASPFADRVTIVCEDVLQYALRGEKFDCIVTNPPFFTETLLCPEARRAQARHTAGGGLTWPGLLHAITQLTDPEAAHTCLSVILPAEGATSFTTSAAVHGLHLWRRTEVRTRSHKPCKRVLLEFGYQSHAPASDTLELMDCEGRRTAEYAELCREFYL